MSEIPVAVTNSETKSRIDIKEIANPDEFRSFSGELRMAIGHFEDYFIIRVRHEPEKPKVPRKGNSYEWQQYNQVIIERERGLNEIVLSLDPSYKPETISNLKKIFNREEVAKNERARKQTVVDRYNASLFNKLLEVSEAYMFGDKRAQEKIFNELLTYVSKNERPDRKRQQANFQERAKSEHNESLDEIVNNYGDFKTPCDELKTKLDNILKDYKDSKIDSESIETYSKLLDYVKSKKSDLLILSSKLDTTDVGKIVYIPQLNTLARVRNTYFDKDVDLHLEVGMLEIFPVSEDLVVIPYEKMFSLKAPVEANVLPQEIEYDLPEPDRNLSGFLNKLLINEQKLNMDEIINVPGGISNKVTVDLITKDLNPFELTRGELLNAGYVFINALGGGEKYIVEQVVEIDGQIVDLAKLPFLTARQLQAALDLDKSEFEQSAITIFPKEIAKDMMDFLHGSFYFYTTRISEVEELLKIKETNEINRDIHEKAKEQVDKEWKKGKGYYYYKRVGELAEQLKMNELDLSDSELKSRASSLADQELAEGKISKEDRKMSLPSFFINRRLEWFNGHCPMLNCSHRFRMNNNLTFVDDRGPVRLSTVVAHLAYHGLSERGDGLPISVDQRYMTITEYYKLMMQGK